MYPYAAVSNDSLLIFIAIVALIDLIILAVMLLRGRLP